MLRIVKLLKNLNITQIKNQLEDSFGINASTLRIITLFGMLIFISHLIACTWWGLTTNGTIDDDNHAHWYEHPL